MGNYTRAEIIKLTEEEDVEFVRLMFTDMFGVLKNIAITARELPRALENKFCVDGSLILGIASGKEENLYLHPDLDTFTILPWRPQQGKVARFLCDVYRSDGTPVETSCRYILKKVADKAKEDGYICQVDPECEFFLFHTDDHGMPTTVTHEKAGYLDISPLDLGENARRDMIFTLEDMGVNVESSHHESAPAQHEIDFRAGKVKKIADQLMTLKMTVRIIAKRHGLHATFMPKPLAEVNGSGLHIHFSLYKNHRNVFESEDKPGEYSKEAKYFIGGLLAHSREMALITNPLINSYKRLVPGYEAPTQLAVSEHDVNAAVRLPYNRKGVMTVELRTPDPAANPYLLFAVCLAAGLDGIKNKIDPEKAVKKSGKKPEQLPESLNEAIRYFEESTWIKEILGEEFSKKYLTAKKDEWKAYSRQVTQWEVENYLYRV